MTGSYEALLVRLALGTLSVATLMLFLPRYDAPRLVRYHALEPSPAAQPATPEVRR